MDPTFMQVLTGVMASHLQVHQAAVAADSRVLGGVLTATLIGSNSSVLNMANQTPHANNIPAAPGATTTT